MKTNAPEKIYLVNDDLNIKREWYKTKQVGFDTTEYTRTDVFIERAENYLKDQFIKDVSVLSGGVVHINFSTAIKNFVNYMKGE